MLANLIGSVANLKRRLVGLDILKPSSEEQLQDHILATSSRLSDPEQSDSASSQEESDSEEGPDFIPESCLFCSHSSSSLEDNITHMYKTHGLFIPDRDRIIVDLKSLLRYLHLVIFQYRECLYCHSQRKSAEAAQQHMIGKGHCKFDISSEESEFADFYAESTTFGKGDGDSQEEEKRGPTERTGEARLSAAITKVDSETARLSSGKLFSHRATAQATRSRHQYRATVTRLQPQLPDLAADESNLHQSSQQTPQNSTSLAVAKGAKREATLALQLDNLSISDRAALAHLSAPEQRSLLSIQKRELSQAKRVEKRFRSRVELMANSVKRSNFRNDEAGHDGRRRWNV